MPQLKPVRAAFSRYGGKYNMLPVILPLLPRHEVWLEAFAGAAWLTFAKPPAAVETINDLDDGVVNFYRVLRDPALLPALVAQLEQTPYARTEKETCRKQWKDEADPIEKARQWFVAARQSVNASPHEGGWNCCLQPGSSQIQRWRNAINGLAVVHRRLQDVQIEHSDFRKLLKAYNAPNCLVYLDPPYVRSTRSGPDRYSHEMTDDDHRELVDLALQWRGHCLISGYAHPIYKALERPGWYRIDTAISACSAAGRRTTKLSTRTETLWMNYDPAVATGQRSLF